MKRWAYLDTHAALDTRNRLGKEGWELAAVTRENIPSSSGTKRIDTFHFKRPLVEKKPRRK